MTPSALRRKQQSLQRKIKNIAREIEGIESTLYSTADKDRENQYFSLQQKRNHAVRGIVLELQLAIEDLLNLWLKSFFLHCKPRYLQRVARKNPVLAQALDQLLAGSGSLSFEKKLELVEGTRLIRKTTRKRLSELYSIRNKCSHNWLLDMPVRKKIQRNQPKRRLVEYRNRNLFEIPVLTDFVEEYGSMYYKLFMKVYA
jgi:hypothetical protein